MSFCFHFKRDSFECGIPGLLTPRVDKVVDFLRRGYVLGRSKRETDGSRQDDKVEYTNNQ